MCALDPFCENVVKPYFENRAKRCAQKDFLKFKKSLKKIIVSNGLLCDMYELHGTKHDFDEKISYSFIVKSMRVSERRITDKSEYTLPNISFDVTSYPRMLREEYKEIYMETFESIFRLETSWNFDTIVKLPLSIFGFI